MQIKIPQKKNSLVTTIFSAFFSVVVFPLTLHAQALPSVSLQVTPENYTANEQVTVSLSSFNVNLDKAMVEWEVDGVVLQKGVGLKQIKTTAPDEGADKELYVLVTTKDSEIEKTIVLRSETIEFYIESVDGYTPVWYEGRPQIAEESVVKVVAVPTSFNTIEGDTARVYTWSKNNFKDPSQSGRGRQAYTTKLSPFANSEDIAVEVGNTSAIITLRPYPTSLSLYEYSPLVGTRFEKTLGGDLSLSKDDVTFEVVPWFFSTPNRNSSVISMSWTLNGLPTKPQGNRSLLNLRKGTTQKGRAVIGITVKHKERTLQSNRATLNIDL